MGPSPELDVVVVGAGPAGLAVAHALNRAGRDVAVLEEAASVGGRMATLREDGFVVDTGAEMIATHGYPATWRLLGRLGIGEHELPRVPSAVSLWRDGRVHPNVGRPLGLLTGAGLTARARLGVVRFNASVAPRARAYDPDHPERTPLATTTVAQLADRYGRELREYMFEPLVGAMFGWDPERSAAAPLVSLLLATRSTRAWRTYRDGMDTLARRLAEGLDVRTGARVEEVVQTTGGARLLTSAGAWDARAVVLCVPAPAAAALHPGMPGDERAFVEASSFGPMLRVSLALREPLTFASHRRAYVVLVPAVQNPVLSVVTIDHNKAPGRAPRGRGLISLLTHPAATRELLDASDAEIVRRVGAEAELLLPGLRGAIERTWVHRFRHGLPEATPAALRARADFVRRPPRAVEYAGDWLMVRPNSEAAVRAAELAVERVLARGGSLHGGGSPDAGRTRASDRGAAGVPDRELAP